MHKNLNGKKENMPNNMPKLNSEELQKMRWLRALGIAKILFDDEGYFDDYLRQIEQFVKEKKGTSAFK